jgi:hypothetical protein
MNFLNLRDLIRLRVPIAIEDTPSKDRTVRHQTLPFEAASVAIACALVPAALVSRFDLVFMIAGTTVGAVAGITAWWLTRAESLLLRLVAVALLSAFWSVVGGVIVAFLLFVFLLAFSSPVAC